MYCPNCGRKIDDIENTKFCLNCGTEFKREEPKKKSVNPKVASAILAITLVLIAFASLVVGLIISYEKSRVIHITDEKEKEEMFQKIIDEQKGTSSTPAVNEPATNNKENEEIDPDFYEEGFWINDLKQTCATNVFSFTDTWKGKRILVSGYISHMDTAYDDTRYIILRPYDFEIYDFDYDFHIVCYLEGDGGEMVKWIDGNNYCSITGELDVTDCSSDKLTLKHCYVYSVE